jgi:hypothetical protein
MPAVAEMLCQRCGAQAEAVIADGRPPMDRCRCGGMRQVVRVVHYPGGEASASRAQVERNVRQREGYWVEQVGLRGRGGKAEAAMRRGRRP